MKASERWKTHATRETWTVEDTVALLCEGGNVLSPMASNAKTMKQLIERGIEGRILHMSPHKSVVPYLGRDVTVCVLSDLCEDGCLATSGRGQIHRESDLMLNVIHRARLRRTLRYFTERKAFNEMLKKELTSLERAAKKKGLKAVARLDGTSDLGLADRLSESFPGIMMYDYTKVKARMLRWLRHVKAGTARANYDLTFSRGATNESDCMEVLKHGGNVAIVFDTPKGQALPTEYQGVEVLNGDEHDFRYEDPKDGYWIGLHAKGRARHDESGFVVHVADINN